MSEVSCENCHAACCKGTPLLIMQLSPDELGFMRRPGNVFQTIAEPVNYDREEVIYPAGAEVNQEKGTLRWLAEPGREYEPLLASFGRYALFGACKYLEIDENGWEQCSVYERRPEVCRNFEMAGEKCLLLRMRHGIDNTTP